MERLYEELARLVEEIDSLRQITKPFTPEQQERFELWQHKARNLLSKIYGPKSEQVAKFDAIDFSPSFWMPGMGAKEENEWYQNGLTSAKAFLRSLLETDRSGLAGRIQGEHRISSTSVPKCFMSASFDPDAATVLEWFRDLVEAVGFDVIWLKEFAEPRPPEEKVKEYLRSSSCLVQVLTRDVEEKGKERGWIGNEMAWSDSFHGKGRQGLFAEAGVRATGIGPEITEVVGYERDRLHEVAPKAVVYLRSLLANIQTRS